MHKIIFSISEHQCSHRKQDSQKLWSSLQGDNVINILQAALFYESVMDNYSVLRGQSNNTCHSRVKGINKVPQELFCLSLFLRLFRSQKFCLFISQFKAHKVKKVI
jgi:hypothetical protein